MISILEAEKCIFQGDIIEHYPDDPRGESSLMVHTNGRPVHVVCAPKNDYLAVITAYLPDPSQWSEDFRQRRVL